MQSRYDLLYSNREAAMLQDGDDAISACALWEWIAEFNPTVGERFLVTPHPNLTTIIRAIHYDGHTEASFAWTMRTLQTLARLGWARFVQLVATENPPCPCRRAAGRLAGVCDRCA